MYFYVHHQNYIMFQALGKLFWTILNRTTINKNISSQGQPKVTYVSKALNALKGKWFILFTYLMPRLYSYLLLYYITELNYFQVISNFLQIYTLYFATEETWFINRTFFLIYKKSFPTFELMKDKPTAQNSYGTLVHVKICSLIKCPDKKPYFYLQPMNQVLQLQDLDI